MAWQVDCLEWTTLTFCEQQVIEIEISKTYGKADWREDLKRLLSLAGGDGKQTTFLFTGFRPSSLPSPEPF